MSKQNYAFPLTKTETQENRLKNAIDTNIFLNIIKALTTSSQSSRRFFFNFSELRIPVTGCSVIHFRSSRMP